ncbi:MAG: helix-turn-helix transcriptional regulator, partial [Clostridia bacterium]|nr:helix-turn-helix transcriptional regulator [Clostridia bacterium]
MNEWHRSIQRLVEEIDRCIHLQADEALTLHQLAQKFGYSEYHFSRKFKEISGMSLRDYLRYRRLAFALKQVRDTDRSMLDIALDHGFSSGEAFSRAFREAYGCSPAEYRHHPVPVVLRTILKPFDCYLLDTGGVGMHDTAQTVKTYIITIPAHKFLHIRNYQSIGYWDY